MFSMRRIIIEVGVSVANNLGLRRMIAGSVANNVGLNHEH
jgi:hypothetical protein